MDSLPHEVHTSAQKMAQHAVRCFNQELGRHLDKRFCQQFSENSPCLHGQQGSYSTTVELSNKLSKPLTPK